MSALIVHFRMSGRNRNDRHCQERMHNEKRAFNVCHFHMQLQQHVLQLCFSQLCTQNLLLCCMLSLRLVARSLGLYVLMRVAIGRALHLRLSMQALLHACKVIEVVLDSLPYVTIETEKGATGPDTSISYHLHQTTSGPHEP